MKNILILSGSGISAESGIPTFRDNGLWDNFEIPKVATLKSFLENPISVNTFYDIRRQEIQNSKPNVAHYLLVELERKHNVVILTQNVDDLHERAGSKIVVHLHGNILKSLCNTCQRIEKVEDNLTNRKCSCGGLLRPDVVWFGECPHYLDYAYKMISLCDLFVSIGTSNMVSPVCDIVDIARKLKKETVEINLKRTNKTFDIGYYGLASAMIPKWIETLGV
jgi:NAD-dependent deacetylase